MEGKYPIVDAISVDPQTGTLELHIIHAEAWDTLERELEWILERVNTYVRFVESGQLRRNPKWLGRPISVILHCQHWPPLPAMVGLKRLGELLRKDHDWKLTMTLGGNVEQQIDVSRIRT